MWFDQTLFKPCSNFAQTSLKLRSNLAQPGGLWWALLGFPCYPALFCAILSTSKVQYIRTSVGLDIFCDFATEWQGESRFMFRLVSESINLLSLVPPPPTQQSAQPQMNEHKSVKHHQKILTMTIWYPYLTNNPFKNISSFCVWVFYFLQLQIVPSFLMTLITKIGKDAAPFKNVTRSLRHRHVENSLTTNGDIIIFQHFLGS